MRGTKVKKMRKQVKKVPTVYKQEGTIATWGAAPIIAGKDINWDMIAKLRGKIKDLKLKAYNGVTFLRYSKGNSRLLDESCTKYKVKQLKRI